MGTKKKDSQNCKANAQEKQQEKTSGKETDKETAAFTEAKSSKDTHAPAEKEAEKSPKACTGSVEEGVKGCSPKESMNGKEAPCFSDAQKSTGNTEGMKQERDKEKTTPTLQEEPVGTEEPKAGAFCGQKPDERQGGKAFPENSPGGTRGHIRHRIRMRLNPNRAGNKRGPVADRTGADHGQGDNVGPGDDGMPPFGCPEVATKEAV